MSSNLILKIIPKSVGINPILQIRTPMLKQIKDLAQDNIAK
jgi:hypothetical protein